jgi:hypothetical protein
MVKGNTAQIQLQVDSPYLIKVMLRYSTKHGSGRDEPPEPIVE